MLRIIMWLAISASGDSPLEGLNVVVPVAKGKASWGTAEVTEAVRAELSRAVGPLMKPETLTAAQVQLLAEQSTDDLAAFQKKLNTPSYLARAGRTIGAQYIVRLTVAKTFQGFNPSAAIIDVESGEVVETVKIGRYRRTSSASDMGRSLGRAVVRTIKTILTLSRPPVVYVPPSQGTKTATKAIAKFDKPKIATTPTDSGKTQAREVVREVIDETSAVDDPEESKGEAVGETDNSNPNGDDALAENSASIGGDTDATGASFSMSTLLGDAGLDAEQDDPIDVFLGLYVFEDIRVDVNDEADKNDESMFDAWTRAFVFIEPRIGATTKFRVSADADFYAQKKLNTIEPIYSFDLEEAYFFHAFDSFQLKIGKQITTWGTMDTLSPENVLNPRDVRFSLVKANDQGLDRVPIFMGRGLVPLGSATLDMVFVPFVPVARAYFLGTDFSSLRPGLFSGVIDGFKQRITRELPVDQQPIYLVLADSLSEYGRNLEAQNSGRDLTLDRAPENLPINFGGGARLNGTFGDFEYGAAFLTSHEFTPRVKIGERFKDIIFDLPRLEPEEALAITADLRGQFDVTFPRFFMFGADAGFQFWRFAIKAEAAYRTLVTYYDVDLNPIDARQLDAVLHLEYVQGSDVTFILEAQQTHVFADNLDRLILFKQDNTTILGRLNFKMFRERLDVRFDAAYELKYRDFYLAPSVAWKFTDELSIKAGAELYMGPEGRLDYDTIADPNRLSEIDIGTFSYYRGNSFAYTRLMFGF
jgi:hypothetical protein